MARKALEERVARAARDLLKGGDQAYLSGLSHAGLLEALETELRFLGLYAYEDQETPVMIWDILRQNLDAWWPSPIDDETDETRQLSFSTRSS